MNWNGVQSPRFEGGELHFFAGDTFSLQLNLTVKKNGTQIDIGPEDKIHLVFKKNDVELHEMTFENIENNTLYINWDKELTRLFRRGNYEGSVVFENGYVRTILNDFRICVE